MASVLALEAALLVWLVRYWFRRWLQALGTSRDRVATLAAGLAIAAVLLHLGLSW